MSALQVVTSFNQAMDLKDRASLHVPTLFVRGLNFLLDLLSTNRVLAGPIGSRQPHGSRCSGSNTSRDAIAK
jgi:hypothetical protein